MRSLGGGRGGRLYSKTIKSLAEVGKERGKKGGREGVVKR